MNSTEENEKLAKALKAAERKIFVPPTLDESILKQCRAQFSKGPSTLVPVSWSAAFSRRFGLIATPALILIAAIFFSNRPHQFARGDINHDGRVDILDALILARAIESKTVISTQDQNGDRNIDSADVNFIAAAAVRIAPKI